ncbi:glycosyltransferase [Candidatus Dojkabacteria bacterium]|nr:glycosyltransferase [Candidatus Dojkabacteria bacterium]
MKKGIVILGMHRSGTSAVAGTLRILGCDLGESLFPPTFDNEKGNFENVDVHKINEQILKELKSRYSDVQLFPKNWWEKKELQKYKNNIETFLKQNFRNTRLWCIKDPRLCILLPIWESVFQKLDLEIKYIYVLRDFREVASSLNNREGFSINKSTLLWLKYNLFGLLYTQKFDRGFITFDKFLQNPYQVLQKVTDELQIKFPSGLSKNKDKINEFLNPDLRHQLKKNLKLPIDNKINRMAEKLKEQIFSSSSLDKQAMLKEYTSLLKKNAGWIDTSFNRTQEFLEDQINTLNFEKKELHKQLKNKEQESEIYKREVKEVKSSISWKITSPLRQIVDLLKVFGQAKQDFFSGLILLKREGVVQFIKRCIWYLKGHRFITNTEDTTRNSQLPIFFKKFSEIEQGELIFPKNENVEVSIIIPVRNKWEYTFACLYSILENTEGITYEIIIADDASTDKTKDITAYVKNIKVSRNEKALGFSGNCNKAVEMAEGDYVFLLNNDTYVQKDWLSSVLDLFQKHQNIGLVGSKLIYPNGQLQEAGGIIWQDGSGWNYGRGDEPSKPEYNYVKDVDYCSGAAICIPKLIWDKLEGFDERYAPAYYEDVDLAFSVRSEGLRTVFQPLSRIVHFEGISHGTKINQGIKKYQVVNKQKFRNKWREVLTKENFKTGENIFQARDRTMGKPTIVIIDHYVPHFDKDTGSKSIFMYIKLFRKMGMNVKFVGDNFLLYEPYTTELEQLGVEVLGGNYYRKNFSRWIKANREYIDYVLLNRPYVSQKYIELIRKYTTAKILYYGIDLHYLREKREYELNGDKTSLKQSEKSKKLEYEIFRKSDVIYYPSSVEVDIIKSKFPDKKVRQIPVIFYEDEFTRKSKYEDCNDLMYVGGFKHPPNKDAVLWFVEEIFPSILEKIPDVKFHIIGGSPPSDIENLQSESINVTGYISDEELIEYYRKIKVVVIPLRYGAGVKGKLLEAMYYQVPVVTTSIGAEGLREIQKFVPIVDDTAKFVKKVTEIYQSKSVWNDFSKKGSEYIKKYFMEENAKRVVMKDFIGLE